jgi:hypothetical protein
VDFGSGVLPNGILDAQLPLLVPQEVSGHSRILKYNYLNLKSLNVTYFSVKKVLLSVPDSNPDP